MAEFKITRFRYIWRGTWSSASVSYKKDDVVFHRGSTWVCIRAHTSSVFNSAQTFIAPGNSFPSPAWVLSVEGRQFLGEWSNGTIYDLGSLVYAGGNLYLCVQAHTSSAQFSLDSLRWEIYATGSNWRNIWAENTRYRVGDVIRYNGWTYQCVLEHTSGTISQGVGIGDYDGNEDSTSEIWTTTVENYIYVGEYAQSTRYRINDLVKYGGTIFKCIEEHTSGAYITDEYFTTYLPGYSYSNVWSPTTYYAQGDIVAQGGLLYVADRNNYNSQPGNSALFDSTNPIWQVISSGQSYQGEYDPGSGISYKAGTVVRRGGALWISLVDQIDDDSSLMPFDSSNWKLVIAAQNFRGSWRTDQNYNLYDVVVFRGVVYYSNTPHLSSFENFPGDNGSGFEYWTITLIGNDEAALFNLGDLLTYNLKRNILEDGSTTFVLGDTSTLGTTAIPIGALDQALIVENSQGDLGYETWGRTDRKYYVRTNGVDDVTDPERGKNYLKPWKTIRYALEQVDDGFLGTTTISVSTGEYQEVLPLIIPARTAVVGEELRSTTIRASDPISALAGDAVYTLQTLVYIGTRFSSLLQGIQLTPSPGNTEIQTTTPSISSLDVSIVSNIWASIIQIINFKVNAIGSSPIITGSNTETESAARITARIILEANRGWIKEEAIAFMAANNPGYDFDRDLCRRDLDRYIDAVKYDLLYPGNYKSVLAGRYYANAVIGSQLEDMFYVRDTSGLRNVTLKGLAGTLPALQAGETYRIPTGGAFISLDPGWGPADQRVWITNRSHYVQNVTTFGTGAIGQKVDGSLHNGGNRSIVSNDFTQVISDGIGAWITNNGRAELVSVFTYYAHIGMFAKDGGIIRATNGNSSYGDFGAVADGIDPNEIVRIAKVNTRTEQATVISAFAGEVLDFILGLEFGNCGQEYTTAGYTIVSSGTGAESIQEEFRDDAVFETQVLTRGSGYRQFGNQAQFGNKLTITLATAETAETAQLLGMRIIIISGPGTGQYGYVQAYNSTSKLCTVYKESDDQPGWDHILPGTESADLLTTGTRYRIEPRITFSAPPYSATNENLGLTTAWSAIVYGETSGTFTGVTGSSGTGTTIEVVPADAVFTVNKIGRRYEVVVTNGGAGYAVGDTITIDGALVGGLTDENDIILIVTAISDDSTNSVTGFTIAENYNIAASGRFVITPNGGDIGRYSNDGDTWQELTMPTAGQWRCLATGNNIFVAIRNNSNQAASSLDGETWTARTMPSSRQWSSVIYGKPSNVSQGVFVAVAENLNSAAFSITGTSWTASTLPTFGDSTLNQYIDIAFGSNVFVALANSGNIAAVGTWNGTSISWQGTIMDVIADSSARDWVSIAYGNRRFVAISSTGDVGYSFDGLAWLPATMPTQDGSTAHYWRQIRYGQGVFFAVGDSGSRIVGNDPTTGPTRFAATSYDGVVWTNRELVDEIEWGSVAFGNPDVTLGDSTVSNSRPTWIAVPSVAADYVNKIYTGARTLGRVVVSGIGIGTIKMWEPGSGYVDDPVLTITDPNNTEEATFRTRRADGVLAQPKFLAKGSNYKTSTTSVFVSGDGFADKTPNGKLITLDDLEILPGPGAQFYIAGQTNFYAVTITGINEEILPTGKIRSTFQVSPALTLATFIEHDMEVIIREQYSQVRITGHDFLDVGVGNFEDTNYPDLYQDYSFTRFPNQEVQNLNGGRVFYTSTDQDGNFRAGNQFAVEQATGIITLSAEFFDLSGLTELRLAGINVGSTAVIREFSKDPLMIQNSNNVIPTQRAIVSFLQNRLNVGGEDLLTPGVIAGTVRIGPDRIDNAASLTNLVPVIADFSGAAASISGTIVAMMMLTRR